MKKKSDKKPAEASGKKHSKKTKTCGKSPGKIFLKAAIVVLVIAAIIYFIMPTSTDDGEDIAATVNGDIITMSELETQFANVPEQVKATYTKELLLEQMINEKILYTEAVKQGFEINDALVDEKVELLRMQLPAGITLEEVMSRNNITLEEVREQLKKQFTILEFLNSTLYDEMSQITISEAEIQSFYSLYIAGNATLESVREQIVELLTTQKRDDLFRQYMDELKTSAEIHIPNQELCFGVNKVPVDGVIFYQSMSSEISNSGQTARRALCSWTRWG